jgi:hypothetical protein
VDKSGEKWITQEVARRAKRYIVLVVIETPKAIWLQTAFGSAFGEDDLCAL